MVNGLGRTSVTLVKVGAMIKSSLAAPAEIAARIFQNGKGLGLLNQGVCLQG